MRTPQFHARTARPAFTLLEVILATAIGVILLAALYAAVDIQYKHAQAARDVVEQSTLARALLARIGNDIACSAGPTDPSRFRTTSSRGGSSQQSSQQSGQQTGQQTTGQTTDSSQTTQQSGTQQTTGQTTTGQTTDPASGMTSGQVSGLTASGNFIFTLSGDSASLSLFVTRVQRESKTQPDLRRISYWLVEGTSGGLAFEEIRPVTSDEAASPPPDVPDGVNSRYLATEVRSLSFSYFDGTSWQSSWDGTVVGSDGQTPIGPPLAVAITLGLAAPGTPPGVEGKIKMYRHVVSLMTANSASQQTKTDEVP